MRTFTRIFVVLLIIASAQLTQTQAQDIHFSQFYSSPLTLNPAMTGNISEHYRVSATYRNQWSSIPAPYSTVAASADVSLLGCQLGMDHVGVGAAFFSDRSGDGRLTNNSGLLSVAYHKGLDMERRYVLSVGVQGGFINKSVDFSKLLFENQITDNLEFDPSIPNNEPVENQSFSYFDLRAGGLFTASPNDRLSMYLGGSYYHFTQPGESFLQEELIEGDDNVLDPRIVFHGGGSAFLSESFSISPSILYMSQTASTELIFGAAFGLHFNQGNRYRRGSSRDNSGIYLGGWYRLQDAVVFLLGVDYQNFRFGFSYDVNVSGLREATLNQGAVELSLMYSGRMAECKQKTPTYCPRF